MSEVDFRKKPGREQLDAYISTVAWLTFEVAKQAREAQVQVLGARSPEHLAAAVSDFETRMLATAAGWAKMVEQMRDWA